MKYWLCKLDGNSKAERTINLHAVMHQISTLKSRNIRADVEKAARQLYPDRSTRVRLLRLSDIPLQELRRAMNSFKAVKEKTRGDGRSSAVLSTTHLEALSRCRSTNRRLELLKKCGEKGWTAQELRERVVDRTEWKSTRPLELAKRIRSKVDQLSQVLISGDQTTLLEAVDGVRPRDVDDAVKELKNAAIELRDLRDKITRKANELDAASAKLVRKSNRS